MTERILIGDPPIELRVRRSARARRYGLRISRSDGAVILTVPSGGTLDQATNFAGKNEAWLRRNLEKTPQPVVPLFGDYLPVDGCMVQLRSGGGKRPDLTEDALLVPGGQDRLPGRLRAFYKLRARDRLVPASQGYAAQLGRQIGQVSFRDTRSRWGSCTSQGKLMYSWRLAMAPPAVQDYVAAHEVCHLVEMNHSREFWRLVAGICPDYQQHRNWLRLNGTDLHRYRL